MTRKNDIDKLYKDAYVSSLLRKGLTDYLAEVTANRFMQRKKEL